MIRSSSPPFIVGSAIISAAQLAFLPPFFSPFRVLSCKSGILEMQTWLHLPVLITVLTSLYHYPSSLISLYPMPCVLCSGQIKLFQGTMFCLFLGPCICCSFCPMHSSVLHPPCNPCTNSHTFTWATPTYPPWSSSWILSLGWLPWPPRSTLHVPVVCSDSGLCIYCGIYSTVL